MDFVTLCQALGMALAVGLIVGAMFPAVLPDWGAIAGAIPIGIVVAVMMLTIEEEAVWPALVIGPIGAGLASVVSHDVATGAQRRAGAGTTEIGGGPSAGIVGLIFIAAFVAGAASYLAGPVALVFLAALVWILFMRRRQAERKHEGLRILR